MLWLLLSLLYSKLLCTFYFDIINSHFIAEIEQRILKKSWREPFVLTRIRYFFCFVTTSMPEGEMLLQLEHHLLLACELYLAWLFWVSNFASCSLFLMSSGFDNFIAEIMG